MTLPITLPRIAVASILALTAGRVSAATFSVSGPGGPIPDPLATPGTWNVSYTGTPFTSVAAVANPVTSITAVKLNGFTHSWRGDLHIILKAPGGAAHNVVVRPGFTGAGFGDAGDYSLGNYSFVQTGGGSVAQGATNIVAATYNQFFNAGAGQWTLAIANTPLNSITGAAGNWTLEIRDWAAADIGSLTGWTLEGTDSSGGGPFTPFCGNPQACPCAQAGTAGSGCNNSDSTGGALLVASGTSVPDTVVLTMTGGPVAPQLAIFFQGDAQVSFPNFGDGVRCVGGNLFRLYIKTTSAGGASAPQGGDPSVTAASAAAGDTIAPGSVRYYQVYYRDGATFCTADTFNSSSAVAVQY